jgi:hypothetical protein
VLQWWWRALNSCIIPCDPKVCGFYAQGRNDITKQSNMATCPSDDPAGNSEVFANCADIRITGGGNGGQDPNKSENAPSSPAQTAPATHAPAPRTANPATTPSPAKSPVPTVPSEPTPSPAPPKPATTPSPAKSPVPTVPSEPTPSPAPPKPATTPSPAKAPAPAPKTAPAAPRPSSVQKPATIPSPTTEPPKSEGPRPSAPTSVQQPRKRFRTRSCNAWDCSTKRGFNKCRSYCTELRNTRCCSGRVTLFHAYSVLFDPVSTFILAWVYILFIQAVRVAESEVFCVLSLRDINMSRPFGNFSSKHLKPKPAITSALLEKVCLQIVQWRPRMLSVVVQYHTPAHTRKRKGHTYDLQMHQHLLETSCTT